MINQLMTATDVANYLGIPRSSAYEILHRSNCPTISWGRNLYIRREDLDDWILLQRRCHPRKED